MPGQNILPEEIKVRVEEKIEEASEKADKYVQQAGKNFEIETGSVPGAVKNIRENALRCYKEIKTDIFEVVYSALEEGEVRCTLHEVQDLHKKIIEGKNFNLAVGTIVTFLCIAVNVGIMKFVFLAANLSYGFAFFYALVAAILFDVPVYIFSILLKKENGINQVWKYNAVLRLMRNGIVIIYCIYLLSIVSVGRKYEFNYLRFGLMVIPVFTAIAIFICGRLFPPLYVNYMYIENGGKKVRGCSKKRKDIVSRFCSIRKKVCTFYSEEGQFPEDIMAFYQQVIGAIYESDLQMYKEGYLLLKDAAEEKLKYINIEIGKYGIDRGETCSMEDLEEVRDALISLESIDEVLDNEDVKKHFDALKGETRYIEQGKKHIKLLLGLISSFFILTFVLFFLCGKEEVEGYTLVNGFYKNNEPAVLVMLLGNHANAMKMPEDAYYDIEELLDRAVYGGYSCAVVVDSTPTKVELTDGPDFFQEDARNAVILRQRIDERKEKIIDILKNADICADSPEVDLLAALHEAQNIFESNQNYCKAGKQICIVDTGISTAGDLNFVNLDILYSRAEIDEIANRLKNYGGVGVLPDLTGVEVIFIGTAEGLAEAAKPQEISTVDKKYVKDLWQEIINECNADKTEFRAAAGWDTPNIYTEDNDSAYPYVSAITFSHEEAIDFSEIQEEEVPHASQANVEIKLSSEAIGFMPDGNEYLNDTNTRNMLQPLAEDLKKYFEYYPDEKIWIVGTTAAVPKGTTGSVDLSLQRAEAVKNTLVTEFGIREERLVTIGLGAMFPWHVDEYPEDVFDTETAQANRAVWILTPHMETDYFNKLKVAYDNGELLPEAMKKFASLY